MDTPETVANAPGLTRRQYALRATAAGFVAVIISLAVRLLSYRVDRLHSESIAFASFLFCIPILMPVIHPERPRSWTSRLGLGFVFALIGGLIHAFFIAS